MPNEVIELLNEMDAMQAEAELADYWTREDDRLAADYLAFIETHPTIQQGVRL